MMYPRLKLARNLLTDDGAIFISIDDNEVMNLKKICDEIFGANNFIAMIPRKTVEHIRVLADYELQKLHDFILVYSKNKNMIKIIKKMVGEQTYEYKDELGEYTLKGFQNSGEAGTREARPNLYYPIYLNGKELSLEKKENSEEILPKKIGNKDGRWLWSKEKFLKDSKFLIYKDNRIYRKIYYNPEEDQNKYSAEKTWLEEYPNRDGAKSLTDLNLRGFFDYTKPVMLIKFLINLILDNKDKNIILDFFSGSATTAHAVIQLNAEDGGNRKYIMVQLPEETSENSEAFKAGYKNICEIGKERIRRAGDKIKKDESLSPENREKLDTGFKVFKLNSSNIKEWDPEAKNLREQLFESIENIKDERTSLDVLYEILLKYGLDLNVPIKEEKEFYSIGGGSLLINLNKEIDLEVVSSICEKYKKLKEIDEEFKITVILRDNSFKNDVDKTNAIQKMKQIGITDIRSI